MVEFSFGKMMHLYFRMLPCKIRSIQQLFKILFFRIHNDDTVRLKCLFFQAFYHFRKSFVRLIGRYNNIHFHFYSPHCPQLQKKGPCIGPF